MFLHRQSLGLTYTGLIDDLQDNVRLGSLVDAGASLPLRPCTGKYGQALWLISSLFKREWLNVPVNVFRGIQDNQNAFLGGIDPSSPLRIETLI